MKSKSKDESKKIIFLVLLIAYIIILIIGAIITIPNGTISSNDKLMHLIEFFGLSLIIIKTLQIYDVKYKYILALLGSLLIALVSEGVQLSTSTRSFSVYDLIADTVGILIGIIIFKLFVSKWKF